jgi:methionyl-tRNA synthetase
MYESFRELFAGTPLAHLTDLQITIFFVFAICAFILKGFSLWYAARGGQRWWFVALLIINTLGILEIVYLIWFRPRSFEIEKSPMHSASSAV